MGSPRSLYRVESLTHLKLIPKNHTSPVVAARPPTVACHGRSGSPESANIEVVDHGTDKVIQFHECSFLDLFIFQNYSIRINSEKNEPCYKERERVVFFSCYTVGPIIEFSIFKRRKMNMVFVSFFEICMFC